VIRILEPFSYLEEDFEDYIGHLRWDMENFLEDRSCPVCQKSLRGGLRHVDCSRLDRFRLACRIESAILNPDEDKDEMPQDSAEYQEHIRRFMKYIWVVENLEKALKAGFLRDGTPWNAPRTNTQIKMEKPAGSQSGSKSNGHDHSTA